MTDDVSQVPRDLYRRLSDLDEFEGGFESGSGTGVETLRALPDRDDLPDCPACASQLLVDRVYASGGGVAVAIRLQCANSSEHPSASVVTYVYEIATRQLYLEGRGPDDAGEFTLSVERYRRDLERAARGESIESILSDRLSK